MHAARLNIGWCVIKCQYKVIVVEMVMLLLFLQSLLLLQKHCCINNNSSKDGDLGDDDYNTDNDDYVYEDGDIFLQTSRGIISNSEQDDN